MINSKIFEEIIGGKKIKFEFSKIAEQANSSVVASLGETVVLVTCVISKSKKEGIDYFPLLVDYEERFYAAGKISGSRFIKREARPSENAVLTARLIDRGLRPLFNQNMRNDVQVVATVLSMDGENDPDVLAINAASIALSVSDIPWNGPLAACRIGRVGDKFIYLYAYFVLK